MDKVYDFCKYRLTIREDNQFIIDDRIFNYVYKNLTIKRFMHSLSVANLMYDIAVSNGLDNPAKFFFVGFLHDVGKYLDKKRSTDLMKLYFKEYLDLPKYAYHAFVGSYMITNDLSITDKEINDAIIYHTTGNSNLSVLGIVLFAADKIEPLRPYNSKKLIKLMRNDCVNNFKYVVKEAKDFLDKKGDEGNYLSNNLYKFYL